MIDDVFANDADGQRSEKRGGRSFSRDVAQHQRETSFTVRKKIVKISAEFASRTIS